MCCVVNIMYICLMPYKNVLYKFRRGSFLISALFTTHSVYKHWTNQTTYDFMRIFMCVIVVVVRVLYKIACLTFWSDLIFFCRIYYVLHIMLMHHIYIAHKISLHWFINFLSNNIFCYTRFYVRYTRKTNIGTMNLCKKTEPKFGCACVFRYSYSHTPCPIWN